MWFIYLLQPSDIWCGGCLCFSSFITKREAQQSLGCSNWGINSKNLSLPEPVTPRQRRFWKHAPWNSNMMLWEKGFLCLNALLGISDLSSTLTSALGLLVEAPDLCLCFPTWKVEVAIPAAEGLPGLTTSCLHNILGCNNEKCMYSCRVLSNHEVLRYIFY